MCNCVNEVSANVIRKMKEKYAGKGIVGEGSFTEMGFSFEENSVWHTSQQFEYELTPTKKDGTDGKQIKKSISIYHTYCPFCGEKIKKD